MNATQFAITDGTDLAEGEDGTCVNLGFTFDAGEDCVEPIKCAFRAAGWEIDGNLDFDATIDPDGDSVLVVYAR